jgi:hypothetical protein
MRGNDINLHCNNLKNMPTIKELNEKKIPIVRIDNTLEKYKSMPISRTKWTRLMKF